MLIENGKINYNGLKAPLLVWPQLEHFSPPRQMLCAVDHLDYAQTLAVYAYDPDKDYPVITEKGSFKYCADVPVWTYELARGHLSRALPGLVKEKDGSLYYIGNGAPEGNAAVIATQEVVYFGRFNAGTFASYKDLTLDHLDVLARNLKEYNGKMAGRATCIELAKWCSTGHGMWKFDGDDRCYTRYDPILGEMNMPVPPNIRIWPWDTEGWIEPTRENMGITKEKD